MRPGEDTLAKGLAAESSVEQGTMLWQVRNTDLACCLVAVGIPLRKDPPYTHIEMGNGFHQWTFLFEAQSEDGILKTSEMIHAFSEDMKWIEGHPEHPFTYAMCAVKNVHAFKQHMNQDVPFVGYRSKTGRAVLYVKSGSRKDRNAERKGLVRI